MIHLTLEFILNRATDMDLASMACYSNHSFYDIHVPSMLTGFNFLPTLQFYPRDGSTTLPFPAGLTSPLPAFDNPIFQEQIMQATQSSTP